MVNDPRLEPKQLRNLKLRTLVIAGTKDIIQTNHTRLIYENLPNAELTFIEGDHFIANKKPEKFNQAVDAFLTDSR